MRTLDQLKAGERAIVYALKGETTLHQRIQEMGVIEGANVEVIRFAPLGDPMEILIHGYHLSLRKAEAAQVEIE